LRVPDKHWLHSSGGSKWRAPREHNLAPLAAFIAQQFPTQNLFEDTEIKKPKMDVLDRQALTLSRLQNKVTFLPSTPEFRKIFVYLKVPRLRQFFDLT